MNASVRVGPAPRTRAASSTFRWIRDQPVWTIDRLTARNRVWYPMMIAAIANARSSNNHHGVLSASTSRSRNPNKSTTPGNFRRMGAGGTARKISHNMGKPISPSNKNGVEKAIGPMANMVAKDPWPKRDTTTTKQALQASRSCEL